jgi:hypothetical protein
VTTGGEFYAVYTLNSTTKESQQSLKISLGAKIKSVVASASMDLETELNSIATSHGVSWKSEMKMSGFRTLPFPTPEEIISFGQTFGSRIPDSPVVVSIQSTPYEQVRGFGSFANIPANRTKAIGGFHGIGLVPTYLDVMSLYNAIDAIKKTYQFYGSPTGEVFFDPPLIAKKQAVLNDLNMLGNVLQHFSDSPSDEIMIDPISCLSGTPVLNIESDRYGGGGGVQSEMLTQMGYPDLNTAIRQNHRVKKVAFQTGKYVDRLEVTYLNNQEEKTFMYGGSGGGQLPTLTVGDGEYINSATVKSANLVDQLYLTIDTTRYGGGGGGGEDRTVVFVGAQGLSYFWRLTKLTAEKLKS